MNGSILMRSDIKYFVKKCHHILSGDSLDNDPYLKLLYDQMTAITDGSCPRQIVNLPPGVGKTFTMSVCLTAWYLGHHPSARVMIIQHGKKLSKDATRNIKKIMNSRLYKAAFETRIDPSHAAHNDFGTTAGGTVYASSVNSGITGDRADLIIVDDPVEIRDANNLEQLTKINNQFDAEIVSRGRKRDNRIVLIMHRLSEHDLTAHLIAKGEYEVLAVPMLAEERITYKTSRGDWHREIGEQIRPNLYSAKRLENLKNEASWYYLYQQGLGRTEAAAIVESDFLLADVKLDRKHPVVLSIDPGQKVGTHSSRSVIQAWQFIDGSYNLIDLFAERCDYSRLLEAFRLFRKRYRPSRIIVEDTANGSALISQIQHKTACPVFAVTPSKSKIARLKPHIDKIKSGLVHLPLDKTWSSDWVNEVALFPHGENDDNVDAMTMMFDNLDRYPNVKLVEQGGGMLAGELASSGRRITFSGKPAGQRDVGVAIARYRRRRGY